MKKLQDKTILMIYLLVFFGVAATVALLQQHMDTPPLMSNPPDEAYRYLIPRYICRYGTLPNGYDPAVRIPSYGFSYAFYNMFPYILQGYFMRFVSIFTKSELVLLYTARFFNVICGTLMAATVYGIANRLFKDRRFKWMFCVLTMYLPQSLFIHTYVNTDSMCLLSTALILYAFVRAVQEGFTVKNSLLLSAGIILCALSYYNAYGYILSSILLFMSWFLSKNKSGGISYDWKRMLKRGFLIAGVVLAGIGWYFIRNAVLYDGDFLGIASRELCASMYASEAKNPLFANTYAKQGISVFAMLRETNFFAGMFISFVAAFGAVSIVGNIWIYHFYKAVLIVGLLSGLLIRRKKEQDKVKRFQTLFFHANMIFCILMPIILCIYYSYTMDFQNQGRYILPCVVPLMYYATAGLEKLAGLNWLPEKFGRTKTFLKKAGNAAAYATITLAVVFLAVMVFGYAVPAYLAAGSVL